MHNHIRHIFFDLDHTLWDFETNSGLTFERIFELHSIEANLTDFLEVYKPINFYYWKLYREEKITKPQLRYGRLKDAFNELSFEVGDDLIHKLSYDYIEHLTTFDHVFEGTHDILKYLQKKYVLHIITNGFEEAQERKMKASNLRLYFATVTNSEMAGVKKPNPQIFNHALNNAGANPSESVMIGDNLEADIEGAVNVGMDAILFDQSKSLENHNYKRVSHLLDLKDIL